LDLAIDELLQGMEELDQLELAIYVEGVAAGTGGGGIRRWRTSAHLAAGHDVRWWSTSREDRGVAGDGDLELVQWWSDVSQRGSNRCRPNPPVAAKSATPTPTRTRVLRFLRQSSSREIVHAPPQLACADAPPCSTLRAYARLCVTSCHLGAC
jgi:hypothetical protein